MKKLTGFAILMFATLSCSAYAAPAHESELAGVNHSVVCAVTPLKCKIQKPH